MLTVIIAVLIALADQAAKHVICARFGEGDFVPVIAGFFDIHYVRNTGAAWGMFAGFSHWLVVISVLMLLALIIFRRAIMLNCFLHRLSTGLIVGGIIGNLIDRVRLGYVVDFLDFYVGARHFPAFNIADAAICTGVGIYIISQWLPGMRPAADDVPETGDEG